MPKKYDEARREKILMQRMKDAEKNEQFRQAHQAVIDALSYEKNGLTIVQLQTKARLSARTLNQVLSHTSHVKCENNLYFLVA